MCSILVALTYNNWLLGPFLNRTLWVHNGSVSEYSVAGQPFYNWFRLGDVISGLLLIYLAYSLYKTIGGKLFGRLSSIIIAVLGLANILDAIFKLPCSQTLSSDCQIPISVSIHNFHLPAHAYSSSLIGICYFLAPLLVLIFSIKARLGRLSVLSAAVLMDSIYSLVSTLVEYHRNGGPTTQASGASQEIEMLLIGIWLVCCIYDLSTRGSKALADMRHRELPTGV